MLDKLFSDEKIFRIFTFCSIIILFFIVLKKNKKEKFVWTAPANDEGFKTKVETALGENIQAIKNLGEFASALQSGSDYTFPHNMTITGNLNIDDEGTNVNVLDTIKAIQNTIVTAQNKADAAHSLANGKTTSAKVDTKLANYVKYGEDLSFWNKADSTNRVLHMDGHANGVYQNKHKCIDSRCINIIKKPKQKQY